MLNVCGKIMKILNLKRLFLNFFISSYLFVTPAYGQENTPAQADNFDQKRWSILLKLVDSEIHTIKSNKYSGADLKHRLFELYSEKIKLIKEKENHTFLQEAVKEKTAKRDDFFKNSKSQFETAQKFGLSIIKQYPKYKNTDLIYYALAINSRDYDFSKETEKFLLLAIHHFGPSKNTQNLYNAQVALAEHYYNSKNYSNAIKYYNEVLKVTDNEWYGKHLYNAGWCHLKNRNFPHALSLLLKSHEMSKNPKYISMNDQIIQAAGLFFVQADQTYQGIDFYLENTPNEASKHLISLANSSMSKNNFSITHDVLKSALSSAKKRKNTDDELKVRNAELAIYKENKKDELFYSTAGEVHKLYKLAKLNEDELFLAQNKIKEVAGFMQINLIKDKVANPVVYSQDEYQKIIRYFDILGTIDAKNKQTYRYYQGETALATQNYDASLKYYVRAVTIAKKNNEITEITKKSLDALLATLEKAKLSKKLLNAYAIFGMKNYIIHYPKDSISQTSYSKLFNIYFDKKDFKKALNILLVYKKSYKDDIQNQRAMLTLLLDHHIKSKQTRALTYWVNELDKGFLSFEESYVKKSIQILGGLLFEKYQGLEKRGQFKQAIAGYKEIYEYKKYPKVTKAQAAYAIATLSLDLNKPQDSVKWLDNSFELYQKEEILKLTPSILNISLGLRLFQDFKNSQKISLKMIDHICETDKPELKEFYRVSHENMMLENYSFENIVNFENKIASCHVADNLKKIQHENNLQSLVFLDKFNDAITYYNKFSFENEKSQGLIKNYVTAKFYQDPERIKPLMQEIRTIDFSGPLESYGKLQEKIASIKEFDVKFTLAEKFDEELYNSELEQYFSMIQDMDKSIYKLSKTLAPNELIILKNYAHLPYQKLILAVDNFFPRGVDQQYLQGFKEGMRQITESLRSKLLQSDREKSAFLQKNQYFFQVQKNVIFALENNSAPEKMVEKQLHFHSAKLFANTVDIAEVTSLKMEKKLAGN